MMAEQVNKMKEHTNWQEIRDGWYAQAKSKEMSLETLPSFLKELSEFHHDYNTICYALAAGAVATCWALDRAPGGGITGFQAGAIMWEFMGAWNGIEAPAWLRKGQDLLFPQYESKFTSISAETWKWVQAEASKKLAESHDHVAVGVIEHWQQIKDGKIPFDLKVAD